ncbi:long-chain fatty acid--CoA ligase [Sphingomonas sp.]|jgi:acyl-CoA synthetase (AMP-forming)/AMP-acid ligase II|uniref:acyl-CoA synthetase n=1 Tax=Sphingomonas sp. TaxID=28214 RepID=UPI0026305DF7|nr:long-chain fatty acid--CoA ligase [Sphingomonas sp.]MDF2493711.1 AMP-binding protein [Sphingomonas sp.]
MLLSEVPVHAAHRAADRIAVRLDERAITYAELRDDCWRLGNALLGIAQPGDRIAILAENCLEYALCYYGVPGAGMTLTFLNYRLAPAELAWIVNDAAPSVLIVQDRYLGAIQAIRDQIPSVAHLLVLGPPQEGAAGFDAFLANGAAEPPPAPDEDSIAWLLYTSGTTGLPKGAMLTHRNVMAAVFNSLASWDKEPDSHYLLTFPMYHVAGYGMVVNHLRAAELTILPSFVPETLFAIIERHRITSTAAAPTMIALLLDHPSMPDYDLSSLRNVGYGASAMPAAVLLRAREKWPQVRFGTGFGMTELAGNVMVLTADEHDRAIDEGLPILNSVGRQMLLARVRVVDEGMNDVPPGSDGEIVVKGDQVLTGYWRNPEATAKAFTDGWFHTGDVGRWDADGYLTIVDRKKDMIVTGGENVYPREVEEVLYRHPAVLEAAVVGMADPVWGESVIAIIAIRDGAATNADALIQHCRDHIASYKKPKAVAFIAELPKNASGKVLKRTLRDMLADGGLIVER